MKYPLAKMTGMQMLEPAQCGILFVPLKNREEKMRNFFSKYTLILLLFSVGFALICSYLLLEEFTSYTLTAATFSYAWFLQMILIQLLGFTEKTKKKLSITSFFKGVNSFGSRFSQAVVKTVL